LEKVKMVLMKSTISLRTLDEPLSPSAAAAGWMGAAEAVHYVVQWHLAAITEGDA
jgi:hypothetical protein